VHRRLGHVVAVVVALVLACGVVACGAARTRRPPGPARAASADGRRLFIREGCGACHRFAAAGTRGVIGPDLDSSERLDLAQIRQSLVEGSNGMPSYAGRLSRRQMRDIAQFIQRARR
jgi:mono/diheme cytochrome c family protein